MNARFLLDLHTVLSKSPPTKKDLKTENNDITPNLTLGLSVRDSAD